MAETKVTKNEIDGALYTKVITATRDASSATSDVSYTGVGFTPTSISCYMVVDGTPYRSESVSDSTKVCGGTYVSASGINYQTALLATYTNYTSWAQNAAIKSYDSDGFTLTWTKINTPTSATMKLLFICHK